jgi:hypothetical protein
MLMGANPRRLAEIGKKYSPRSARQLVAKTRSLTGIRLRAKDETEPEFHAAPEIRIPLISAERPKTYAAP